MRDPIERQEAIEEFKTPGAVFTYGEKTCRAIISRLMLVPPAKPEIKCISKIMLTDEQVQEAFEKAKKEILAAQPEIIRCRDCKYWDETWSMDRHPEYYYCDEIDRACKGDFYCAYAERRTKDGK